jgi:hypothetical protein
MENIQQKWQTRINHTEAKRASSFQFRNEKAPVVIVDTNYWTFGDVSDEKTWTMIKYAVIIALLFNTACTPMDDIRQEILFKIAD